MDGGDDWLAPDKLQHLLACLFITLLASAVLGRSQHRFLCRWSVPLGCVTALAAGAAKEAGDEIGVWESAGGSLKDGVADVLGVLVAAVFLSLWRRFRLKRLEPVDRDREVSIV